MDVDPPSVLTPHELDEVRGIEVAAQRLTENWQARYPAPTSESLRRKAEARLRVLNEATVTHVALTNERRIMPAQVTPEMKLEAQAHAVGLLNQLEAVLTGWVLGEDRDKIAELTEPLYALLDRD